jgi:hypothetical protein
LFLSQLITVKEVQKKEVERFLRSASLSHQPNISELTSQRFAIAVIAVKEAQDNGF